MQEFLAQRSDVSSYATDDIKYMTGDDKLSLQRDSVVIDSVGDNTCYWGKNMVTYRISFTGAVTLCDGDDHSGGGADWFRVTEHYDDQFDNWTMLSWDTLFPTLMFNASVSTPNPTPHPTPASTATYEVEVEYTSEEALPSGVTATDLMSSTVYKAAKKTGLAAALSVPVSDVTIRGFTIVVRRLHRSGTTVSVKTSASVKAADLPSATALSATVAGSSAHIKAQTDSAMAASNWSGQSVISSAPMMTAPAVATPVVVAAPTPAPVPGSAAATGDPHLQNVLGERFDLLQAGHHVLINIPRGMSAENALLRVQADARRLGGHCADMYPVACGESRNRASPARWVAIVRGAHRKPWHLVSRVLVKP